MKTTNQKDLESRNPIPPYANIYNEEEYQEESEKSCPKECMLETVSRLSCMSSTDAERSLTISIVAIILSAISIILYFV